MTPEISPKSTKNEILEAYENLLKQVQDAKSNVPKQVQEEKQKTEIVNKVANNSHENIVKEISSLKISLNNSLDKLEGNLVSEFKKLEEIRAAIAVEKQNLEDLYALSANTDSLAAMLLVQKEKKESFEAKMRETEISFNEKIKAEKEIFENEMNTLREQWKIEKLKQTTEQKEFDEELKKRRKRDEEEYLYTLKITRQKEQDTYETKKAIAEKELADKKAIFEQEVAKRESVLKQAETELTELRKANTEYPKKLEDALKAKEKEVTEKMKAQFEFDQKLTLKQYEGDLKLKDQSIASLQEKIAEMQLRMKELTDKANLAESNVKDIAVKAIESSSKIQVFQKKDEN